MKSLLEMISTIAEIKAGELPRSWDACSEQDKWEIAFSAGLLAAIDEIRITLRGGLSGLDNTGDTTSGQ